MVDAKVTIFNQSKQALHLTLSLVLNWVIYSKITCVSIFPPIFILSCGTYTEEYKYRYIANCLSYWHTDVIILHGCVLVWVLPALPVLLVLCQWEISFAHWLIVNFQPKWPLFSLCLGRVIYYFLLLRNRGWEQTHYQYFSTCVCTLYVSIRIYMYLYVSICIYMYLYESIYCIPNPYLEFLIRGCGEDCQHCIVFWLLTLSHLWPLTASASVPVCM